MHSKIYFRIIRAAQHYWDINTEAAGRMVGNDNTIYFTEHLLYISGTVSYVHLISNLMW